MDSKSSIPASQSKPSIEVSSAASATSCASSISFLCGLAVLCELCVKVFYIGVKEIPLRKARKEPSWQRPETLSLGTHSEFTHLHRSFVLLRYAVLYQTVENPTRAISNRAQVSTISNGMMVAQVKAELKPKTIGRLLGADAL